MIAFRLFSWFLALILLSAAALPARAAENPHLVSVDWLAAHLNDPDILILDATSTFKYLDGHIPGAVSVSFPESQASSLDYPVSYGGGMDFLMDTKGPHAWSMITDPAFIQDVFRSWGVSKGKRIIVYDHGEFMMATRLFFELYYWGVTDVAVLDGGYFKWTQAGKPVIKDVVAAKPGNIAVTRVVNPEIFASTEDVLAACGDMEHNQIFSVLTDTFHYSTSYSRTGHIPNAINLPPTWFYNEDQTFKSPEELRKMFVFFGGDPKKTTFTH